MSGWNQQWVAGSGLHRVCYHGQLHPDPDGRWWGRPAGIQVAERLDRDHNCDGCCADLSSALSLDQVLDDLRDMIKELSS